MPQTPHAFPHSVTIEDVPVFGFENVNGFFQRILHELKKPRQIVISYLNVHVANTAVTEPKLKSFLQNVDFVYCDGAGIQLGAMLQGDHIPMRFPAADWIMDFFTMLAKEQKTVFLLGGQPGVTDTMLKVLNKDVPEHTVVGAHHGYIINDPELEARAIEQINAAKPDILIVGFGTPLQEYWIESRRDKLDVSLIMPLGAVMDYFTGETHRCPKWLGDIGFEWLYRLCLEPQRMAGRYVLGNPWFVGRILLAEFITWLKRPVRFFLPPQTQ